MTTQLKKMTPNIMVEDVKGTIVFYTEILGFELVTSVPQEGEVFDWAMLKRDTVEIMFQSRASLSDELPLFAEKAGGGALTLYIDVTDIDALYAAVKGKARLVRDMHTAFYGAREFVLLDCNGFVLTFAEQG